MLDVLINYLFMYVPQRNKWINFYFELFEIHNTYFPAHSRICLLFRFFLFLHGKVTELRILLVTLTASTHKSMELVCTVVKNDSTDENNTINFFFKWNGYMSQGL